MPLVSSAQARAVTVPLIIQQGTDFSHVVSLQNSDGSVFVLSGYSAKMQVKEQVVSVTPLLELSTVNGRISVNGLAGQLTLTLTNALTTAMTWRSGIYDLEITSGAGLVTRVMEGSITLSPEVTI
jgi:hypothetical protein